jgi:parallel beta-helix repeat protein
LASSNQSYTIGIDLWTNVEGVIVENFNIKNFSIGTYVWTKNNTVTSCRVLGCVIGILMSGSNTTITRNIIVNNTRGLFFGFNNGGDTSVPDDMVVAQNSFEDNQIQFNGCQCIEYNTTEPPHNWDNGAAGNFWSDYNGTDTNGDGVGDSPYVIDILNRDRYPLMQSAANSPTVGPEPNSDLKLPWELIVFIVVLVVASVGLRVALGRYRRKA